jgi:Spermine/spermidine synthase domain
MPAQFTGSEEWGAVRSVEFFTAHSRNPHKRKAYAKAAAEFAPGVTNTASISSTRCNPSWRFAVPPTAVESNSDVIALRDEFLIPRDDFRFSVVRADGAAYLAGLRRGLDTLLVDALDRKGIPASLANLKFYEDARRCLRPTGVFVMNLAGEKITYLAHLDWIREVFGEAVIAVPVDGESNYEVFRSEG